MPSADTLLLVAPNWLGDLVMATSLLSDLRALDPAPAVHLLVRDRWAALLRGDPRLDGLIPYAREGRHAGPAGNWRLARELRGGVFGSALVMPPSLRAAAVTRLAGIRATGFASEGRGPLLSRAVRRPPRGEMHYTEELALLLAAWRDAPASCPARPALPPPPSAAAPVAGPPLWVVGVGATYGEAKSWPLAHVLELAERVAAEREARFVLVGDGAATVPGFASTLGPAAGRYDLRGRTALDALAGLLAAAAVYVGNDSGPMHLAAALGAPTLGIFGSTNPVWTRPRGACTTVVAAEDFDCSPCYLRSCPRAAFCLDAVPAARVHAAARALLDEPGAGPIVLRRPADDGAPRPTLFLDRDGVVIEDTGYVSDPAAVRLLPGVAAALRAAAAAGLRTVLLTNQSGIGRGHYGEDAFRAVQARVDALLAAAGVRLDAVLACPHAPQDDCNCRKPRTGLLDALRRTHRWDPRRSRLVGDKASDLALARRAGLRPHLVRTGEGAATERAGTTRGAPVHDDLAAAVSVLLKEVAP
jgi:lipopolysaccharide heptosyltransferase II